MRILVLTTEAFGGHGGIALYNRHLLAALSTYPDCTEVVAIPRLMLSFIESLPSRLTYITEGLNSKLKYMSAVLRAVHKNPKFDLIICGHINLLPVVYLLRLWVQAPVLLVIYGIDVWKPTQSRLVNYLVGKIDGFISISELTKQRFLGWANLKSVEGFLLPNAIDLTSYGPGPKNTELLNRYGLTGKKVLLTVGRLVSQDRSKGFDEVLDILPELIKEIPDLVYLIVGDGNDRQRLKEKAASLGIEDRVIFTGYVSESEKADYYRLADVYVMPGRKEGFGFVFLEAMACGIPVIASKVDGSREAVGNGEFGILVDPDNPEEIKAGIFEALRRPKGVVPKGLDYFSYENFERRCHGIIDQVVHKK